MWNAGNINVELVHTGPGVRVEKFRSEGTGFKSVRDVHWREEEVITFWVKGGHCELSDAWLWSRIEFCMIYGLLS